MATALNRMTMLEATMDNPITDAYLDITGADVAFSHGWRYPVAGSFAVPVRILAPERIQDWLR